MNDTVKKLLDQVREDELVALLADLVRIPSHTMYERREKDIAEYLFRYLEKNGVAASLVDVVDGRPNVYGVIEGTGGGKSLMLNGHIDTVPPNGMDNPFGAEIRDGRMYGRGASDMKAGVAAMAYAVAVLGRAGVKPKGDIVFAGVVDEDAAGSAGTRHIVANGPLTDYAIVGEPTSLVPVIAHKGIDYFEVTFTGKANHSSMPQNGVNAVFAAAEFIRLVETELVPVYEAKTHPHVARPTVNPGLIIGSALANRPYLHGQMSTFAGIIPDDCTVSIDVRWTPYQTLDEVREDLRVLAERVAAGRPGCRYKLEYIPLPRPAMEISPDNPLTQTVLKNLRELTGEDAEVGGVNGWADSGLLFGLANVPSMLFGPGDMGIAHSDVEWVELKEMVPACKLYLMTAADICGF